MFRLTAAFLAAAMTVSAPAAAAAPDLGSAQGSLQALVKMRCSLNPQQDEILWWKGTVFAEQPGKKSYPLMGFEGYNICRAEKQADGAYRLYTREIGFYRDLKTGKILEHWKNPISGKVDDVIPVENDPVNMVMSPAMKVPWVVKGDSVMLSLNIPLAYPNPLQPDQFPRASSGPTYFGSEHFMFFTSKSALANPRLDSAPVEYGWTRVGPWLPWMKLGTHPGNLLYIAQGKKLTSFDQLPEDIQKLVRARYPKYEHAPETWEQPNATSWTVYKKHHHPNGNKQDGSSD